MLSHELLRDEGILILRPAGKLAAADFQELAAKVDPYINEMGGLNGLLLDAEKFPGWADFAALLAHLRFVRGHHRLVRKIAAVSDSTFLTIAPAIANHFVAAEIRHFPSGNRDTAMAWLRGG